MGLPDPQPLCAQCTHRGAHFGRRVPLPDLLRPDGPTDASNPWASGEACIAPGCAALHLLFSWGCYSQGACGSVPAWGTDAVCRQNRSPRPGQPLPGGEAAEHILAVFRLLRGPLCSPRRWMEHWWIALRSLSSEQIPNMEDGLSPPTAPCKHRIRERTEPGCCPLLSTELFMEQKHCKYSLWAAISRREKKMKGRELHQNTGWVCFFSDSF